MTPPTLSLLSMWDKSAVLMSNNLQYPMNNNIQYHMYSMYALVFSTRYLYPYYTPYFLLIYYSLWDPSYVKNINLKHIFDLLEFLNNLVQIFKYFKLSVFLNHITINWVRLS